MTHRPMTHQPTTRTVISRHRSALIPVWLLDDEEREYVDGSPLWTTELHHGVRYAALRDVVHAIERSRRTGEIVTLRTVSTDVCLALRYASDDCCTDTEPREYWGADWRVHVCSTD